MILRMLVPHHPPCIRFSSLKCWPYDTTLMFSFVFSGRHASPLPSFIPRGKPYQEVPYGYSSHNVGSYWLFAHPLTVLTTSPYARSSSSASIAPPYNPSAGLLSYVEEACEPRHNCERAWNRSATTSPCAEMWTTAFKELGGGFGSPS